MHEFAIASSDANKRNLRHPLWVLYFVESQLHGLSRSSDEQRPGSAFDLPRIAPDNLSDAEQRKDRSIDDPVLVADHEPDPERQIESLQNPNRSHGDHRDAEESADDSHDDVERGAHRIPHLAVAKIQYSTVAAYLIGLQSEPEIRRRCPAEHGR
jgi:hypothetical protein